MAYEARLKAVCRRAAYRGEGGEMRTTARARARARARAAGTGRASERTSIVSVGRTVPYESLPRL